MGRCVTVSRCESFVGSLPASGTSINHAPLAVSADASRSLDAQPNPAGAWQYARMRCSTTDSAPHAYLLAAASTALLLHTTRSSQRPTAAGQSS
jgi:hypothetical protein